MIFRVDEGFEESEINPFTGVAYDNSWMIYCLTNSKGYQIRNGGRITSTYALRVSKMKYPEWKMSVMDFLDYQESYNKNVILSISEEDYKDAQEHYGSSRYNENRLRDYEPDVFVHSTEWKHWEKIMQEGCLKSWNILKRENADWENVPIGKNMGDPIDFSDYVMLSGGGREIEIVVLSKQQGKITLPLNFDLEYNPGARLYFDAVKIAKDGLLVRDGCHMKVKDSLPLKPYLLWVGTWESVGLSNNISTPNKFSKMSDELFNKTFNKKIQSTFYPQRPN